VTKYDAHILSLTMSVYKLFECPSYLCTFLPLHFHSDTSNK